MTIIAGPCVIESRQFSRDAYTSFIDKIDSNPNLNQALLITVLEENYRIDQLHPQLWVWHKSAAVDGVF